MINIRKAQTPDEFHAIYKFRYSIAVGEMKWNESYANHKEQLITDSLDSPNAIVLGAWHHHDLVGISRTNFVRDGNVGNYLDYYQLNSLPCEELAKASITSPLMVHPKFRCTTLTPRLVCETYRRGLEQGIETNYCDCDPHLVSFYIKLGYSVVDENFVHPEFGPGYVMKLDMHSLDHLIRVRSPFHRVLADYRSRQQEKRIV